MPTPRKAFPTLGCPLRRDEKYQRTRPTKRRSSHLGELEDNNPAETRLYSRRRVREETASKTQTISLFFSPFLAGTTLENLLVD